LSKLTARVTLDNASEYRTKRLHWTHNHNPRPAARQLVR